jgi:hypothetical protein
MKSMPPIPKISMTKPDLLGSGSSLDDKPDLFGHWLNIAMLRRSSDFSWLDFRLSSQRMAGV